MGLPTLNLTPAVNAVKGLTEAITRLAKATEHSNQLAIEINRNLKDMNEQTGD